MAEGLLPGRREQRSTCRRLPEVEAGAPALLLRERVSMHARAYKYLCHNNIVPLVVILLSQLGIISAFCHRA